MLRIKHEAEDKKYIGVEVNFQEMSWWNMVELSLPLTYY